MRSFCVCSYGPPNMAAITRDSVALCSAPYKALRFAPPPRSAGPSGLDGACAPRTTGCYVMAAGHAAPLARLRITVDARFLRAYSAVVSPVSQRHLSAQHSSACGSRFRSTLQEHRRALPYSNMLADVRRMRLTSDHAVPCAATRRLSDPPGSAEAFDVLAARVTNTSRNPQDRVDSGPRTRTTAARS